MLASLRVCARYASVCVYVRVSFTNELLCVHAGMHACIRACVHARVYVIVHFK